MFDPEIDAHLRRQAKRELRRRMRALRNAIPASARAARSEQIVRQVVASDLFIGARSVALFAPMLDRNEVDVRPIEVSARAQHKRIAYPFMEQGGDMSLRVSSYDTLQERGNGFAEPGQDAEVLRENFGLLVLVPALAVAPDGHRLGYGKGHYDRLLARIAPPARTLVVAFDFQVLGELPSTEGDQVVDCVVSDARTFVVRA